VENETLQEKVEIYWTQHNQLQNYSNGGVENYMAGY